jgi:hypothetical protein
LAEGETGKIARNPGARAKAYAIFLKPSFSA